MATRRNGAGGRIIEVNAGVARPARTPRKPSQAVYVQLPEDRPEELFEIPEGDPSAGYQDEALQGVMLALGARDEDAKVTVKRLVQSNGTRREEWLFECHPKEFSIPHLQQDFGAGDYRVQVYGRQDGSNYKVVHADKRLSIGAPRGAADKTALPVPAQVPGAPQSEITRAIAEAVGGPMMALANALAASQAKPQSRAEMLAELREILALTAPMRAEPAADPMAMLERAITLMRPAPGAAPAMLDEAGEVSPNAVMMQGLALVKEFFQAAKTNRDNQAAQAAPASAARIEAPKAAPAQSLPSDDSMKLALKMQMAIFLNAAKADSDAHTYAALLYENAPDEVFSKLMGETWWADLQAIEPAFAPYKAWCEKVRAAMIEIDNAPDPDAAPLEGNLTAAGGESKTGGDAPLPLSRQE